MSFILRNEIAQWLHGNEVLNILAEISSRWDPTQSPYPIWGPKITYGLHANEISNFRSSIPCATNKQKMSNSLG